jgi:hypothetical protein
MQEFGPSHNLLAYMYSSLLKGMYISRRELHLFNTQRAALLYDLQESNLPELESL